jgi:2-amino-4-hydroxy-6-hydroxymethyldihydropteridine diphosphokinase
MTNQIVGYLALGSNQGERESHLENAIIKLEEETDISIIKTSSIYETAPVGVTDQPVFLNMVVKFETSLDPIKLLNITQKVEKIGGREGKGTWGPRTIDLDILLLNDENIQLETLQVPHPRMLNRGFVLIPLKEVEPHLRLNAGRSIDEYINQLTDKEGVRKWKSSFGGDGFVRSES